MKALTWLNILQTVVCNPVLNHRGLSPTWHWQRLLAGHHSGLSLMHFLLLECGDVQYVWYTCTAKDLVMFAAKQAFGNHAMKI